VTVSTKFEVDTTIRCLAIERCKLHRATCRRFDACVMDRRTELP